ncbi:small multi-drug export protein [Pseudogracilibacillus sp. SO30301A]|uniref:small multi-drug export protein n=1 Tax=Pseudogracilibacillus sp. SO30301A TaxID=3098291 RepID=UPI00300E120B
MLVTYCIIFVLAAIPFFEIALIIPVAIIGGVPAIPTMIIAFLGNLLTIVLLIVFLDKIREWRRKRKKEEQTDSKRHKRAKSLWDKYGLPGLAFIGPFFVGSHLSVLLAIGFGAKKTKTLYLMTASLLSWTIVLGVASLYGFDFFIADEENLGFITRMLQR